MFALATTLFHVPLFAAKVPPLHVLTPHEALAAFQSGAGLRIEPLAVGRMVDDPDAFAPDEKRRLYVAENRG